MKRPIAIAVLALLLGVPFVRAADYVATTFADAGDYSVGQGSGLNGDLRYCVVQANANPGSRVFLYNFTYNSARLSRLSPRAWRSCRRAVSPPTSTPTATAASFSSMRRARR